MRNPEQRQFDWEKRAAAEPNYWEQFLSDRYGDKTLFTFEEACAILGCVRNSVRRMIGDGKLEIRKVCSSPRITRESLVKYLESNPATRRA